jgi:hypothetical protein
VVSAIAAKAHPSRRSLLFGWAFVLSACVSSAQTLTEKSCRTVLDIHQFVQVWNDAVIGPGNRSHACTLQLLTPDARITGVVLDKDGKSTRIAETPQEFVGWYEKRPNETFWERTLHSSVEVYDNVARITRTYEVRSSPTAPVIATGIEDFELVRERTTGAQSEWKVFAMLWQDASPGHPLPRRYLPSTKHP